MLESSQIGTKLQDTLEQVGTLGRTASQKLDEVRHNTADALAGSASSVRSAGAAIDGLATKTAAKLDTGARQVRKLGTGGPLGGLRRMVRRYPASLAMLSAAGAGFVCGVIVWRKWTNELSDDLTGSSD